MKCEQVKEIFPDMLNDAMRFPDASEHLEHCASCRSLFGVFKDLYDEHPVTLSETQKEANCRSIYKGMRRHDRIVMTSRLTSAAALFMIVLISVFHFGTSPGPSLAEISDEVLFLESDATIITEPAIEREAMIEYLAQYEYIDILGNLF
jgi:predicted anti-sigma-YlaC factor YlaD